jgi:hypothetical protein
VIVQHFLVIGKFGPIVGLFIFSVGEPNVLEYSGNTHGPPPPNDITYCHMQSTNKIPRHRPNKVQQPANAEILETRISFPSLGDDQGPGYFHYILQWKDYQIHPASLTDMIDRHEPENEEKGK